MTAHDEPGRTVAPDGRIVYAWPPEGRFADLWSRFEQAFPADEDRCVLAALLSKWRGESSTLVAYTDESGDWVDVEPDWTHFGAWLLGERGPA